MEGEPKARFLLCTETDRLRFARMLKDSVSQRQGIRESVGYYYRVRHTADFDLERFCELTW
jgi:hypothetical protein